MAFFLVLPLLACISSQFNTLHSHYLVSQQVCLDKRWRGEDNLGKG